MDYKEKVIALLNSQELSKEQKEMLETIFPELKESEDERIIKSLKKCLSWLQTEARWEDIYGSSFDDLFAWLEKQGTPAKLSEEEQNRFTKGVLTRCALSFIDYIDAHKYEGKMCVSNWECEDIENAFHNAMWDKLHRYYCKYIGKQGEQKPADKIEPKFKVKYAGSEYNVLEVKDIAGITYYGIEDEPNHIDYVLPDNCEIVSEQEVAWSEEDENIYQSIMDDTVQENQLDEKQTDWLRNIKYRNFARPQNRWKPSDGQIGLLQAIVNDPNNASSESCQIVLKEVIRQLKKLREE